MFDNNTFEKAPGDSPETKSERSIPPEQDFAKSFENGVPPFAGEQFGTAHQGNDYYGEATDDDAESDEYNEGLSNAASLINYGLDAIAREKGVETVVQGIKSFDASSSDNPLRDLYHHLGVDTPEELDDARDESRATKEARERFRNEYNMPRTKERSREGAIKAIQDMKELVAEVEGADPRYEDLRSQARISGKGYFEYAVKDFGLRGLTDLFGVLAEQKEQKDQSEQPEQKDQKEQKEQPGTEQSEVEQPETEQPEAEQLSQPEQPNESEELVQPEQPEPKQEEMVENDPSIPSGQ